MNPFAQAPRPQPGIDELIKVIIFVIVILFSVVWPAIRQILAKARSIPPPEKRPIPQPSGQEDVASEIEEFMRRKLQRRQAKREWVAEKAPATVVPVRAEVVEEKPTSGQVTEHVRKHLTEQKFEQRETSLGKEVSRADEQIDQHLQQVFGHRVSTLTAKPGETAAEPANAGPPEGAMTAEMVAAADAPEWLELLSSPESLRQMIVFQEILRRPEEQWDAK